MKTHYYVRGATWGALCGQWRSITRSNKTNKRENVTCLKCLDRLEQRNG